VNPTSETILIVLTTLIILIILGAIIIYLHAKEKVLYADEFYSKFFKIGRR